MTATLTTLYCDYCSDPITENLGSDNYPCGRCCHNLPEPWSRGRDGLFTSEDGGDYDGEDEDYRPRCPRCESQRFEVRGHRTQQIAIRINYDASDNNYDDEYIWIDTEAAIVAEPEILEDFDMEQVVCRDCGEDCTRDVSIDYY